MHTLGCSTHVRQNLRFLGCSEKYRFCNRRNRRRSTQNMKPKCLMEGAYIYWPSCIRVCTCCAPSTRTTCRQGQQRQYTVHVRPPYPAQLAWPLRRHRKPHRPTVSELQLGLGGIGHGISPRHIRYASHASWEFPGPPTAGIACLHVCGLWNHLALYIVFSRGAFIFVQIAFVRISKKSRIE